jgi:hypothetical protein
MAGDQRPIRIGGQHPFATPPELRSPARRLRGRLLAPVTVWTAGTPEGSGEPRRGAPVERPEGSGEPRRGAPVERETAEGGGDPPGDGGATR